jgi:hypothetical protein
MNETRIESLLRKAPGPSAPTGLKQQLLADIRLPQSQSTSVGVVEATPFWRRLFPAFAVGLLFLGCLIVLGVQTSQLLDLRRENEALQASTANLEELRQDNAELQQLKTASQVAERRRRNNEELLKLRAEVAELRERARQLSSLRAENQRLQAERAAAAAQAGISPEEDELNQAKAMAMRRACITNIKRICLSARIWANDHQELFPTDFISMSNELNTPVILICPADSSRTAATSWQEFDGGSVSYDLLSPGVNESDPEVVFMRCPIHHTAGMVDGSAGMLDEKKHGVQKVNGKFKIVRLEAVVPKPAPQP